MQIIETILMKGMMDEQLTCIHYHLNTEYKLFGSAKYLSRPVVKALFIPTYLYKKVLRKQRGILQMMSTYF